MDGWTASDKRMDSDGWMNGWRAAAHNRKLPTVAALQEYVGAGWTVRILPCVVGARGMFQLVQQTPAREFLEIHEQNLQKWSA